MIGLIAHVRGAKRKNKANFLTFYMRRFIKVSWIYFNENSGVG